MNKKKIVFFVSIIILLTIIVIIYPVRMFYLNQIGNIFSNSILNETNSNKYISENNKQKILSEVYLEDGVNKVNSVECSYDDENWIKKQVKVAVHLETNDGEKDEYYKCYFKIDKGRCYITEIGLYLDEEGTVTDLD
jgi:hypothetical protein